MAWGKTTTKYRAKKVVADGITFDSKKEYRRYCELKLLEKSGVISELQRQVKYILIPSQREPDTIGPRGGVKKGKVIEKEVTYIADFTYTDSDGNLHVEDVKGFRGGIGYNYYVVKRKLMLYVHGIRIREV